MSSISCRSMWTKTSCLAIALGLSAVTITCAQDPNDGDNQDPDTPGDSDSGPPSDEMMDPGDGTGGTDMGGGSDGGPLTPPSEIDGTETPVSASYWPRGFDLGVADPDATFRALVVFQLRN